MIEADHPDSRCPIDMLSLRRFLLRAQHEVRLEGEVNVRITSDAEMRRLNREFRRKDEPTDVLSFPSSPNGKSELAGDIAISAEIAYANAGSLGHPFEEELKILMLHGLLHLAGYDHQTDQGEMARQERRLRAKLRLPTALIERSQAAASAASDVEPGALARVLGSKFRSLRIKKTSKAHNPKDLQTPTKHPGEGARLRLGKQSARRRP